MPAVRRLAAILAADVAGYSRLMGADEEGTLAALKALLRELADPKIKEQRGPNVKTTTWPARGPRRPAITSRSTTCGWSDRTVEDVAWAYLRVRSFISGAACAACDAGGWNAARSAHSRHLCDLLARWMRTAFRNAVRSAGPLTLAARRSQKSSVVRASAAAFRM